MQAHKSTIVAYVDKKVNVVPSNTPPANSRFSTAVSQLSPSIDGGCFW